MNDTLEVYTFLIVIGLLLAVMLFSAGVVMGGWYYEGINRKQHNDDIRDDGDVPGGNRDRSRNQ